MDELHDINEKIMNSSNQTVFFRSCLISTNDLESIKEKLYFVAEKSKNVFLLTVFLSPEVVKTISSKFTNVIFFTVYHSELFSINFKENLEEMGKTEEYSFNKEFLSSESMCNLFRKQMFSFYDDI